MTTTAGPRLKEALRLGASRVAVGAGLCVLGRRLAPKDGAVVLYGHRVTGDAEGYLAGLSPEWFDQQLSYLSRHYEIVPLSVLLRCYEETRPVPRNSIVLTFDDGFRDNLTNALPILRKYGVSATVFLVTGGVTHGDLPWSQRLGCLFQQTAARSVAIEVGGRAVELPLDTPEDRRRAYLVAKGGIGSLPREQREAHLGQLARTLDTEAPRNRMLSWDEVREMRAGGVEFGAHTWSHPLLARVPVAEARWEMERSREDLREQLGIEHPPFCFPAGSSTPKLVGLVRTLGFRSVFRSNPPHRVNNLGNSHAHAIGRCGLPNAPAAVLEAELDGPIPHLRRLTRWIARRQ